MHEQTAPVRPADARPGDLVFYRGVDPGQPGTRYPHVALYAGNGQIVDASSATGRVSQRSMDLGPALKPEFRRPV